MQLTLSQFIVWLVVGAVAGNLAGRVVTLKKEGLGRGRISPWAWWAH